MSAIKHGPCANCGKGEDEKILKSKTVHYINKKNETGIRSLALCSVCFPIVTTVDARASGKDI